MRNRRLVAALAAGVALLGTPALAAICDGISDVSDFDGSVVSNFDGSLDAITDEGGKRIVEQYILRFGADVLLTFGPDGASGHADHKAAYRWTLAASGSRPVFVLAMPAGVEMPRNTTPLLPTHVVDVSSLGDLMRRAFLEHKTQQDHLDRHTQILGALAGKEYYHRVKPPAEPGPLQMGVV